MTSLDKHLPDYKPGEDRTGIAINEPTGPDYEPKSPNTGPAWHPQKSKIRDWAIHNQLNHYEALNLPESAFDTIIRERLAILEKYLDTWAEQQDAELQTLGSEGRKALRAMQLAFKDRPAYNEKLRTERHQKVYAEFRQQARDYAQDGIMPDYKLRTFQDEAQKAGLSSQEIQEIIRELGRAPTKPAGPPSNLDQPAKILPFPQPGGASRQNSPEPNPPPRESAQKSAPDPDIDSYIRAQLQLYCPGKYAARQTFDQICHLVGAYHASFSPDEIRLKVRVIMHQLQIFDEILKIEELKRNIELNTKNQRISKQVLQRIITEAVNLGMQPMAAELAAQELIRQKNLQISSWFHLF